MAVRAGLSGSVQHVVSDEDTAAALGSGTLAVLGTPRVLAWLEQATVQAVAAELTPEQTTVGTRAVLAHRAPSLVGAEVTAHARVVEVAGSRVTFEVRLVDAADRTLAEGTVTRAVVDVASFLARTR